MKFVKHTIATIALMCAGLAQAGSVVMPTGDLGELNRFPVQFGAYFNEDGFRPFAATYNFTLSVTSDVYGSASVLESLFGEVLVAPLLFGAAIDGIDLLALPSLTPATSLNFSLANLEAGEHTLTIAGLAQPGRAAFMGSVYAQAVTQVPEPAALALVLAGVAVVGGVRKRRAEEEATA